METIFLLKFKAKGNKNNLKLSCLCECGWTRVLGVTLLYKAKSDGVSQGHWKTRNVWDLQKSINIPSPSKLREPNWPVVPSMLSAKRKPGNSGSNCKRVTWKEDWTVTPNLCFLSRRVRTNRILDPVSASVDQLLPPTQTSHTEHCWPQGVNGLDPD